MQVRNRTDGCSPTRALLGAWVALLAASLTGCGESAAGPVRAAKPQRIASLAPSLTELLFELGLGDRVVAVTRFCDRPEAAVALPRVSDSKQVSLEALVDLQPDLILYNSVAVEAQLQPIRSRYPNVMAPTETLAEMLDSIEIIGRVTGTEERAAALRGRLQAAIDRARAEHEGPPRGVVLVVVQRDPFFVAGPGSYVDELLGLLGWENAAVGLEQHWPQVSAEGLLQYRPDVILDLGIGRADAADAVRAYWQRFESLPAVQNGRVYALRADVLVRPGPALPAALAELERCLEQAPAKEPR